jgi:hypothetical protein
VVHRLPGSGIHWGASIETEKAELPVDVLRATYGGPTWGPGEGKHVMAAAKSRPALPCARDEVDVLRCVNALQWFHAVVDGFDYLPQVGLADSIEHHIGA